MVVTTETRSAPRQRAVARTHRSRRTFPLGPWAAVVGFGLFAFAPVYWLLITSITPDSLVYRYPVTFFPESVTFDNYRSVFTDPEIFGWLANSVIVSVITAVLSVVTSMYMGYSISKFRYRGRRTLLYFVLSSQMLPSALLLVTLYGIFATFGLLNTYFVLIISFTTFTLPLCVWMLKGFFDNLPDDIIEASKIDGASNWRTLHAIVLPLAAPGLVASGLFAFMRGWNDFIFALTLTGPERQTLPPALVNRYIGEAATDWPELMAASVLVALPVAVAFVALQRHLVGGITAGAVKG
ncbi:carbohydrate ABC transporter permease [Ruania halotolerans]|uniref:carbohydrate ABC transporter permease n=1 Tax=Ruania halotolerans TaxID=2897773 RepID=UPI001E5FDA4D|nr:carbohydrate ABC transporter permease [Ruania halotolerans]UFU06999.1 carbohydrate ABC transporter permease [Ruania halotolerans]